jgi:hypothetical protein
VETPAEAGCTQDGAYYPGPPVIAATEHEALDGLVANGPETRTYEVHELVGGSDDAGAGYSFVLFRDGRASATGGVGKHDERWSAQITGSCTERNAEVADPPMPAPDTDGPLHTLLLTCTPDGVEVDTPRVRTSAGGVQVVVTDRSGFQDPFLTYGKDGRHHGGNRLTNPGLSPLDVAPGTWQVGCSDGDITDEALRGEVTIVDPDRNWRVTSLRTDCDPDGYYYAVGGEGPTEQAAVADLVRTMKSPAPVRLYPEGYWQRPGHPLVARNSAGERVFGSTYPDPDSASWRAGLDGTCRPV